MFVPAATRPLVMPAEWNEHEATWFAWPHNLETWPENLTQAVQEFVALVLIVSEGEQVVIFGDADALAHAKGLLPNLKQIAFAEVPTNDAWIRDFGPTFCKNQSTGESTIVNWRYNGWGEKYPPFDLDVEFVRAARQRTSYPQIDSDLVVEGGAFEVNDLGLLLTTESCLLNPNRNGKSQRQSIETCFEALLGKQTLWLPGMEIAGDDTDGHVDQQARFIDNQTVMLALDSSHSQPFHESRRLLMERELEVVPMELPPLQKRYGRILPASYLNFYFCNRGLIVPQFGNCASDEKALALLKDVVSDRDVIGLPSAELVCGLGSFHCLTQQQPK